MLAAVAHTSRREALIAKPALPQGRRPAETPVAFTPPPHSIAVLPFVNMSGDPPEYFSDDSQKNC